MQRPFANRARRKAFEGYRRTSFGEGVPATITAHGGGVSRAYSPREGELREDGYLQALNFVIDALLEE